MEKKRIVYFDYLRVFAILSVIILHTAVQNWYTAPVQSFEWGVLNGYGSIVRWGVPVFLMISGTLFLPRQIETKTLYSKYILRLFVAFCVWSVFYAVAIPVGKLLLDSSYEISATRILSNIIGGSYHMWFLPMIIGLYMCLPLLQRITQSRNLAKYFLLLSFLFAFLIPQIVNLCNDFIGGLFASGINRINDVVSDMHMDLVLGYGFYFVLGHMLHTTQLQKKQRMVIYGLGLFGFAATILQSTAASRLAQEPVKAYFDNFNVTVAFQAVAVYTWFQYKTFDREKLNALFSKLSKYSFGAYLVHVFVIDVLRVAGVHTLRFSPLLSVPLISLITALVSFGVSFVLNKIPILKKWLV